MTCPNRDGTVGTGGCIFCSAGGSGDFAASRELSITEQLEADIARLPKRISAKKYIAYFQAYTNTYAPLPMLRKIFTEAISHPDVAVISIATRPDCLGEDVADLLGELNRIKPVWVELGLQTVHESTAAYIRRGYPLSCFLDAVRRLRARGITVITHVILGLPGEGREQMYETIRVLNSCGIKTRKYGRSREREETDLAEDFRAGKFSALTLEQYSDLVCGCIARLRPDIVIHRITGDGPSDILIEPQWSKNKMQVLNHIHHRLKETGIWQGALLPEKARSADSIYKGERKNHDLGSDHVV